MASPAPGRLTKGTEENPNFEKAILFFKSLAYTVSLHTIGKVKTLPRL